MADLQLTNTIPPYSFVGNKIPLRFVGGDNRYQSTGTAAVLELVFESGAPAGSYFELYCLNRTFRFTASADPKTDGTEFPEFTTVNLTAMGQISSYCGIFNSAILSNYQVSYTSNSVKFTARNQGAAYNMTFDASGITISEGAATVDGVNGALAAFYNIFVDLYVNGTLATQLLLNADEDGNAETDVSKILESYLEPGFTWPESNSSPLNVQQGNLCEWYFVYGEQWGEGSLSVTQTSGIFYAIAGGLSWMQQAFFNQFGSDYYNAIDNGFPALLSIFNIAGRKVKPEESIKLYFLATQNNGAVLKIDLITADNVSTIECGVVEFLAPSVIEIIVSPQVLNLDGLNDQTLLSFAPRLEDANGNQIVWGPTFKLDYTVETNVRYFMWRNSLGGYDSIATRGLGSSFDEYERETANLDQNSNYTYLDRQIISVANFEKRKFKVSTGWLTDLEFPGLLRNLLRDLLLSKEVYQIPAPGVLTLIPIRIISGSVEHKKDRDNNYRLLLEYENAFSDEYFTIENLNEMDNGQLVYSQ